MLSNSDWLQSDRKMCQVDIDVSQQQHHGTYRKTSAFQMGTICAMETNDWDSVLCDLQQYYAGFQHAIGLMPSMCVQGTSRSQSIFPTDLHDETEAESCDYSHDTLYSETVDSYAVLLSNDIISSLLRPSGQQQPQNRHYEAAGAESINCNSSCLQATFPTNADIVEKHTECHWPCMLDGNSKYFAIQIQNMSSFFDELSLVVINEACQEVSHRARNVKVLNEDISFATAVRPFKERDDLASIMTSSPMEAFAAEMVKELTAVCVQEAAHEMESFSSAVSLTKGSNITREPHQQASDISNNEPRCGVSVECHDTSAPSPVVQEATKVMYKETAVSKWQTCSEEHLEEDDSSRHCEEYFVNLQSSYSSTVEEAKANDSRNSSESSEKVAVTNKRSLDYPTAPPSTPMQSRKGTSRRSFIRNLKRGLAKEFLPKPPPPTPKEYAAGVSMGNKEQRGAEFVANLIKSLALEFSRREHEETEEVPKREFLAEDGNTATAVSSLEDAVTQYAGHLANTALCLGIGAVCSSTDRVSVNKDCFHCPSEMTTCMDSCFKASTHVLGEDSLTSDSKHSNFCFNQEDSINQEPEATESLGVKISHDANQFSHSSKTANQGPFKDTLQRSAIVRKCNLLWPDGATKETAGIQNVEQSYLWIYAEKLCNDIFNKWLKQGVRRERWLDSLEHPEYEFCKINSVESLNFLGDQYAKDVIQDTLQTLATKASIQTNIPHSSSMESKMKKNTSDSYSCAPTSASIQSTTHCTDQNNEKQVHIKSAESGYSLQLHAEVHMETIKGTQSGQECQPQILHPAVNTQAMTSKSVQSFVSALLQSVLHEVISASDGNKESTFSKMFPHGEHSVLQEANNLNQEMRVASSVSSPRQTSLHQKGNTSKIIASGPVFSAICVDLQSESSLEDAGRDKVENMRHAKTDKAYIDSIVEELLQSCLMEACRYNISKSNAPKTCSQPPHRVWLCNQPQETKTVHLVSEGCQLDKSHVVNHRKVSCSIPGAPSSQMDTEECPELIVRKMNEVHNYTGSCCGHSSQESAHLEEVSIFSEAAIYPGKSVVNQTSQRDMYRVQLQVILQWAAASQLDIPRLSFMEPTEGALSQLPVLAKKVAEKEWKVGNLLQAVQCYCEENKKLLLSGKSMNQELMDWLLRRTENN